MNEHICSVCGGEFSEGDLQEFDGQLICSDCLDDNTCTCACCGERIWNEDDAGGGYIPLCQSCRDHRYTTCLDCGRLIHYDDAYYDEEENDDGPYCYDCYDRRRDRHVIKNYYYKPVPLFYGRGPRYFGMELEIDNGGESDSNARSILERANVEGKEYAYTKHDGSLDDGFEIVTHPLSYDCHINAFPWAEVLERAKQLGYLSHRANTCGLHVHVSRDAFGETRAEQEPCIARILYFVEKNWEELLKFSRRTPRQLERWAARYGLKENPADILDHAKKGYHAGRYTCVNLENSETIEFRMFRGTLKLNTLLATIQMVDRICDVALNLTDEEVKAMSWTTFVSGCTRPELVQYLKERRLYHISVPAPYTDSIALVIGAEAEDIKEVSPHLEDTGVIFLGGDKPKSAESTKVSHYNAYSSAALQVLQDNGSFIAAFLRNYWENDSDEWAGRIAERVTAYLSSGDSGRYISVQYKPDVLRDAIYDVVLEVFLAELLESKILSEEECSNWMSQLWPADTAQTKADPQVLSPNDPNVFLRIVRKMIADNPDRIVDYELPYRTIKNPLGAWRPYDKTDYFMMLEETFEKEFPKAAKALGNVDLTMFSHDWLHDYQDTLIAASLMRVSSGLRYLRFDLQENKTRDKTHVVAILQSLLFEADEEVIA